MRILLTNDDGIHAPGILALKRALDSIGEVFMIAPERARSAAGHAITLHKPLRCSQVKVTEDINGFAVSGTPTDCVNIGVEIVMENRCDMIVSGVNHGSNLGWDVTYSGTVAAALEGATLNIPSIAVSLDSHGSANTLDFTPAAEFTVTLVEKMNRFGIAPHSLLNVNVPNLPAKEIKGIKIAFQGEREYIERVAVSKDPNNRPYYWQAGKVKPGISPEGSDVSAVESGCISVTPIHLDMTNYLLLEKMSQWGL